MNTEIEQDRLLNFLEGIPNTETPTIKTVTIYVTNGMCEETHELRDGDSICALLFDLSLVGGWIQDLNWNLDWRATDWNRLNVSMSIMKVGPGNTNITADIIETLLVKLGFLKQEEN